MRSDGRLGRVIGGFLVVVHMEISAKKRASYAEALEIIKKIIVGLLIPGTVAFGNMLHAIIFFYYP
jgi:hypothetical protein